jgi:hypothetical protein
MHTLRGVGFGAAIAFLSTTAFAQNWLLTIQDKDQGTGINVVNGLQGATASLYGSIDNLSGTPSSDDGAGNPAPPTVLDFAGFGFIQRPGQADLGSRYAPDPRIPGYPQVNGSPNGMDPGSISTTPLGAFDLTGLLPGIYQEDFIASAFPDDINSTILFGDITGTLSINVLGPSVTPEPSDTTFSLAVVCASLFTIYRIKRKRVWVA